MQQPDHSLTRYKLTVSYHCLLLVPGVECDVPVIKSSSLDNRVTRYRLSHRSLCLQFCQVLGIDNLRCTPNPVQQPWQFCYNYRLTRSHLCLLPFCKVLSTMYPLIQYNSLTIISDITSSLSRISSCCFLSGVEYDIPVIESNRPDHSIIRYNSFLTLLVACAR